MCVLLRCLAQKWTEEGELQCGCPHIKPPPPHKRRGELGGEPSWEASSLGGRVVTGFAESLRGWAGGLPVSCRVPSNT